jgi:hypothetical protein
MSTKISLVLLGILSAGVMAAGSFPGTSPAVPTTGGPLSGKQGDVLLIRVPVELSPSAAEIQGRFMGRIVPLFREIGANGEGGYIGLLGIDMQDVPGVHEFVVETGSGGIPRRVAISVQVLKESFPVQHLSLPKNMVDLDDATLSRVKAEQEQVQAVFASAPSVRAWQAGFIEPVHGGVAKAFGRVRMINGQLRSPHNGEDITAEAGTAVLATNDGVARLIVDHYFSGKGVFLDHGLGLYSMYFHLSEILVREGQRVSRGQVIGKVGASGRTTGPHLHWGIRLNGARVNPYSLIRLPLEEISPPVGTLARP